MTICHAKDHEGSQHALLSDTDILHAANRLVASLTAGPPMDRTGKAAAANAKARNTLTADPQGFVGVAAPLSQQKVAA